MTPAQHNDRDELPARPHVTANERWTFDLDTGEDVCRPGLCEPYALPLDPHDGPPVGT